MLVFATVAAGFEEPSLSVTSVKNDGIVLYKLGCFCKSMWNMTLRIRNDENNSDEFKSLFLLSEIFICWCHAISLAITNRFLSFL